MKLGDILTFIHIPRTAGSSVLQALATATGERWGVEDVEPCARIHLMNRLGGGTHWPLEEITPEVNPILISIVRHPLDWLVSVYHYMRYPREDFRQWLYGRGLKLPHQRQWLHDKYKQCSMPCHVLKFENLEQGCLELSDTFGLPRLTLLPSRQSDRKPWPEYYSPDDLEIAVRNFRNDFTEFDYSPELNPLTSAGVTSPDSGG